MKFGKRLKHQAQQSLPEWRDKFLSYKDLKRLVKVISVAAASTATADGAAAEKRFVHLLNREIDKFNAFFMEQEEEFVIRHRELQQRIQVAMNKWRQKECGFREEMAEVRKEIVNFHGEMVLLINYSIINYTGVAKILKKYDKRTGGVLRRPFIKKVVSQPFFTIDIISKLVKECETAMKLVFPPCAAEETLHFRRKAMGLDVPRDGVFRNTVAALLTMQEIRRGSSTYSNFSLPPLDLLDFDVIQSLQVASPIQIP